MKARIQIFSSFAIMSMDILILSCSSTNDKMEGKWDLVDVIVEGKSIKEPNDTITDWNNSPVTDYMIFNHNDTFEICFTGKTSRGRWRSGTDRINIRMEKGDSVIMNIIWKTETNIELISVNCPERIKFILSK